jgi:STE24 endopeptidase
METELILCFILGITLTHFLFERWLSWLNLKSFSPSLPKVAEGIYNEEKYSRAMQYQQERSKFGLFSSSISTFLTLVLLAFGLFGKYDSYLRDYISNEFWLPFAFFGLLAIASDILAFPFQYYSTFVIEEKYGFNKSSLKTFFTDKLKGYLLGGLIGGLLLYCFIFLVDELGVSFWIWFWMVITTFSLITNFFYTSWILPLFNKLKPLEPGELKDAISAFAQKVKFPLTGILVMDGSKRSARANAFFSGMGKKKKIVLFDTLIERHSTDELVAVLAHEVGHYKKKHIPQTMALSMASTGLTLFVLSVLIFEPKLSYALGGNQWAIHLNLLAFGILYSPISFINGLVSNILSRKNEFEADRFAAENFEAQALETALKKLSVDNLSHLSPHKWYVYFNYSHPPLLERIRALREG